MSDLKTRMNDASVSTFLDSIENPVRRDQCRVLHALMSRVTGEAARMWGDSIVGYGSYHYRHASGREGDWFKLGFAPRKNDLTLYLLDGFESHAPLLEKLGKFKTGKCCLYLRSLDLVDMTTLEALIRASWISRDTSTPG